MRKIPKILFLLLHAGLFVYLNFFMTNWRWMVLQNVIYTLLIGPVIFAPLLYPAVYGRARDYLQVVLFPVIGAALVFAGAVTGNKYDLGPFCMALCLIPVIAVLGLNATAFCCRESNLPFRLGIPAVAILLTAFFGFSLIAGRIPEWAFVIGYMGILAVVSTALAWVMSFRILTASDPKPVPVSEEKKTAAEP